MQLSESIKNQIIDALKPLAPEKIIIFGSYAYGNPSVDSDLDICIIKKEIKSKIAEKQKVRELLSNIDLPKDIIVETEDYFLTHSDLNWINTALYDIRTKGALIYEKKRDKE